MVLGCFRLNEAGSNAMVIAKVSPSFTVAVGLRFHLSLVCWVVGLCLSIFTLSTAHTADPHFTSGTILLPRKTLPTVQVLGLV